MTRSTRQRTAIRDAFRDADRPLSPAECLELARRVLPKLGIATVYRNIKFLADEGWLQTVELPGTASRYEVAGKHHHHHFHCRRCDGVFEVEACPGEMNSLTPQGFELEDHHIVLYGRCRECMSGGAARPSK